MNITVKDFMGFYKELKELEEELPTHLSSFMRSNDCLVQVFRLINHLNSLHCSFGIIPDDHKERILLNEFTKTVDSIVDKKPTMQESILDQIKPAPIKYDWPKGLIPPVMLYNEDTKPI